jgi:cytochrome b subunit of formate dehydrogenase
MVLRDQREMSSPKFGACFVASSASMILSGISGVASVAPQGQNWQPVTFARGWARGGEVYFTSSTTTASVHLVMAVVVSGHYEVTLGALVSSWPQSKPFLAGLVNTLLSRITSSSSSAA